MTITIITLSVAIILFVWGKMRSDVVALCALTVLLSTGILTPAEALAGFSSTVVVMMIGLFVVGGAIMQTGLAKAAGNQIVKIAAGSEMRIFILVVLTTAIIGAFISNTGTVALMMPIVVSLAAGAGVSPSRLLMPVAFASSMGGTLTLIGTPPNLVISEALETAGYSPLGFFDFTPIGMVCLGVGVILMIPLVRLFLKGKKKVDDDNTKGKTLDALIKEYSVGEKMRRYRVKRRSPIVGKTLAEIEMRKRYGISILEIRNEGVGVLGSVKQFMPTADYVFEEQDILYLSGDSDKRKIFAREFDLERLDVGKVNFYDLGIAEMVLMPNTKLVNTQIKDAGFRELYDVNILGVKRGDEYISENVHRVSLKAGDVLLVQGKWENITMLSNREQDEWIVLGKPAEQAQRVALNYRAPLAALIMTAMVVAMVFDFIPIAPVTAVIAAALLMVITGCFRNVEAAYKTINWESIVLIAAMMPMSSALMKTGVSDAVSNGLVEILGSAGPVWLMAGIYFTTSIMSLFISNTATAVLMAPIAVSAAAGMGVSPYPMLFAVTLGASMCFASPFATPPNALVMHAGNYTFLDYVKVGLPLQLLIGLVLIFVLPLMFPF